MRRVFEGWRLVIPPLSQRARQGWGTRLVSGAEAPGLVTASIPEAKASAYLRRWSIVLLGGTVLFVTGCRQDMHNQPKFIPQRGSEFFADHRSVRPQVENTVARGGLHEDSYFYTGTVTGANGYREETRSVRRCVHGRQLDLETLVATADRTFRFHGFRGG